MAPLNEVRSLREPLPIEPQRPSAPGALVRHRAWKPKSISPIRNSHLHFEIAAAVHAKLAASSPAVFAGCNSLEFDGGPSSTILLPVIAAALSHEHKWKQPARHHAPRASLRTNSSHIESMFRRRADGASTFELDRLAPANGFPRPDAHDALADVEATIFLARLIRERVPWLWDHLLEIGVKAAAVRNARCHHRCGSTPIFPTTGPTTGAVSAVAVDPENGGNIIAFNLAHRSG